MWRWRWKVWKLFKRKPAPHHIQRIWNGVNRIVAKLYANANSPCRAANDLERLTFKFRHKALVERVEIFLTNLLPVIRGRRNFASFRV
jgi:hypothetical protein